MDAPCTAPVISPPPPPPPPLFPHPSRCLLEDLSTTAFANMLLIWNIICCCNWIEKPPWLALTRVWDWLSWGDVDCSIRRFLITVWYFTPGKMDEKLLLLLLLLLSLHARLWFCLCSSWSFYSVELPLIDSDCTLNSSVTRRISTWISREFNWRQWDTGIVEVFPSLALHLIYSIFQLKGKCWWWRTTN